MEMGKKIVGKCGGVPLAIRAMGSMLFFKDPKRDWPLFVENELPKIDQMNENSIFPVLRLSYDHLPSHLKHCFAYCSLFRKQGIIEVKKLISLWMAEGFIVLSDSKQCPEDVGNEYVMELFSRSFIQEIVRDKWENIVQIKMHDLICDLAKVVAGKECAKASKDENEIDSKTRHLSFDFFLHSPEQIPSSLEQAKKIRSILLLMQLGFRVIEEEKTHSRFLPKLSWFTENTSGPGERICERFISKLKYLRVMDLSNLRIEKVPNSIAKLKHLRYLDLSENPEFKALPNSFTKLINLQILRLNNCNQLRKLPRDFKKLVNLRHFEINVLNSLTRMPRGFGQLTNLQTLPIFELSKGPDYRSRHGRELDELTGLNNLRGKLKINNLRHGTKSSSQFLKEKQHLRSLKLKWLLDAEDFGGSSFDGDFDQTKSADSETTLDCFEPHPDLQELSLSGYGGVTLSSWLCSLKKLVKLKLDLCIKCKNLPPLSNFPLLEELTLSCLEELEYISNNGDGDDFLSSSPSSSLSTTTKLVLPSLRKLRLAQLPELKGWWRNNPFDSETTLQSPPSFPPLLQLTISGCPKLSSLPLFPSVEKRLVLRSFNLRLFEQTMTNTIGSEMPSTSSSPPVFSRPLSNLRSLSISGIEDLQYLPEWFRSLTSLRRLEITECPELACLGPGIRHLVALQELKIQGCAEFGIGNNGPESTESLKNVRLLDLWKLPKLTALPEEFQHLTSLQTLRIADCTELLDVPEWIKKFSHLQELEISNCPPS